MRKPIALTLPLVLAAATLASLGDGPDILARFSKFRVSAVQVRGVRYLDAEEIRRWVPVYRDKRGGARSLEGRLRAHRLIADATVRVLPGDTAEIVVRERAPVALVATPTLNPVDPGGEYVPIDPVVHRLDLPILRPMEPRFGTLAPSEHQQIRAMAAEMHRLGELHPDFARSASEVAWTPQGTLTIGFAQTRALMRFAPPLSVRRLRQGLAALADAVPHAPRGAVTVADLRFQGQVVVRHAVVGSGHERR